MLTGQFQAFILRTEWGLVQNEIAEVGYGVLCCAELPTQSVWKVL